eukprot:jgi/Picsp_1/4924/NSC_02288-R1_protein
MDAKICNWMKLKICRGTGRIGSPVRVLCTSRYTGEFGNEGQSSAVPWQLSTEIQGYNNTSVGYKGYGTLPSSMLMCEELVGFSVKRLLGDAVPGRIQYGKKKSQRNEKSEIVGIVDDVIRVSGDGDEGEQFLLRVVNPVESPFSDHQTLTSSPCQGDVATNGDGCDGNENNNNPHALVVVVEEEHLIPLVESIVPRIDMKKEVVYIDPPVGLLDLGKRRAQIEIIRHKLKPIAEELSQEKKSNTLFMPTRRKLEELGRRDLVRLITKNGGFLEVAQSLNFRSYRRPPGYWEDENVLDRELSMFVAANWVQFEADIQSRYSGVRDDDSEESDDDHIDMFAQHLLKLSNRESQNVINYTADEKNSGKEYVTGEEFANAINGPNKRSNHEHSTYWFNTVTRRMRWDPPILPQLVALDDEGSELFTDTEDDRAMPSRSAVLAAGRYDLHAAIVAAGGYGQVAEYLSRWPAWPPTERLKNMDVLKDEIEEFMEEHDLPEEIMPTAAEFLDLGRPDIHQGVLRAGGYRKTAEKLGYTTRRKERGHWKDFELFCKELSLYIEQKAMSQDQEPRMPTHEELRREGRHDLRHALQKYGSKQVAERLGVPMSRRGGRSRVDKKFRKELEEEFQKQAQRMKG